MIKNIDHNAIITADRNYDSYNNIAHLENKGLKYVIRIKSTTGIVKKFNLTLNEEADFEADILLTRRMTKEVKESPDKYRFLGTNSTFDFLPKVRRKPIRLNSESLELRLLMINTKLLSLIFGTKNFLLKKSRRFTNFAGALKHLFVNLNTMSDLSLFTQKRRTV